MLIDYYFSPDIIISLYNSTIYKSVEIVQLYQTFCSPVPPGGVQIAFVNFLGINVSYVEDDLGQVLAKNLGELSMSPSVPYLTNSKQRTFYAFDASGTKYPLGPADFPLGVNVTGAIIGSPAANIAPEMIWLYGGLGQY